MSKKVLLITLIVLLVVLGVAGVLYPKLSSGLQTQQLATTPPATTEEPDATEATQPETIPATDSASFRDILYSKFPHHKPP